MTILPMQADNLIFEAGGKRLLKEISFTLIPTSRIMVLGANGAGKSLLLRVCHGLLAQTSGQVIWNGQPGFCDAVREKQAMVFQRPVMLRRTALANIEYALKLRGIEKNERRERAFETLKKVGLGRLYDQPARVLSGGEQQRLALARAWAIRPEVLFLDEPTASLDPSVTHSIEQTIDTIANEGTAIIMTTHDLGQARRLGNEVLFMHRGRVLEQAPCAQFFDTPQNDLAQAFVRGDLLWWKKKPPQPGGGNTARFMEKNASQKS